MHFLKISERKIFNLLIHSPSSHMLALPDYGLGKQHRVVPVLRPLGPYRSPGNSFWPLSSYLNSGLCGHLGSKSMQGDLSASPSPCKGIFQIKISTSLPLSLSL